MQPPNPIRALLGLLAVGCVLVVSLFLLAWSGGRLVDEAIPAGRTLAELRVEAQAVGVALARGGPDRASEALEHLTRADEQLRLLRGGGQTGVGHLIQAAGPGVNESLADIAEDLGALRKVALQSRVDAPDLNQLHALIGGLDASAQTLSEQLNARVWELRLQHRALRNGAVVTALILIAGVMLLLRAWDRAWKRSFAELQQASERLEDEIGQRREVESSLRESEERFRILADGAPMFMWLSDAEGGLSFVNQTWCDFVGRSAQALLGEGWLTAVHADDREGVREAVARGLVTRGEWQVEYRLRRADGEYRWTLHRGVPRLDADGGFVGHIGSCVDITGRKRASDAIRDSEGRFRAMAESAYDPVLLLDDGWLITHWNRAAEKVFGYAETDVVGRPFLDMLVPDLERAGANSQLRGIRAAESGSVVGGAVDLRIRCKDGREIPVEASVAALTIRGRWHALMHARDVSERKRTDAVESLSREIVERIVEGIPRDLLLAQVCDRVCDIFALDRVWVSLQDGDGAELRLLASAGDAEVGGDAALAMSRARESGALQQVEGTDPEAPRTTICVPVRQGERVVGVLGLRASDLGGAGDRLAEHLENVAAQVGLGLARAADQRQLRLHGTALEAVANAIFITDTRGVIQWANSAFTELSGFSLDQAVGQTPAILSSGEHDAGFYADLWRSVRSGHSWQGELVEQDRSGGRYTVYQTITPLLDDHGEVSHFIAVHTDITALREAERQLRHQALHDELTGLANRSLFTRHLRRHIMGYTQGTLQFAVLFLDLDRFKDVNDTLGHPAGDALLRLVADRLVSTVRPGDMVARFGGDEFAILQAGLHHAGDAATLAQKLINALSTPFQVGEHELHSSVSVGVAVCGPSVTEPEELLAQADTALYKAKDAGRGAYRFHTEEMQREVVERVDMTRKLRQAASGQGLKVLYQPQVDLQSGHIVGLEALVRWEHPELGLIAPDRFIGVAEDSGAIIPMGARVLRMACEQVVEWRAQGLAVVPVAVNVSAVQFRARGFAEGVLAALEQTGLPPSLLELELTESLLMDSGSSTDGILQRLRRAGVSFSVDDFGTGYSSLAYLKRFPIDKLKIDRAFVRDLATDLSDAAIVRAIIGLGRALGLKIIAEGAETSEQVAFLRDAGCHEVQGYHFYRPLAPALVRGLLVDKGRGDDG